MEQDAVTQYELNFLMNFEKCILNTDAMFIQGYVHCMYGTIVCNK